MEENSTIMNLGNISTVIPATNIPNTNEAVAPVSDITINTIPSVATENLQTQTISVAPEQSTLVQAPVQQVEVPGAQTQTITAQAPVQAAAEGVNPPTPPVTNETIEKKPVERTEWDRMIVKTSILQVMMDNVIKAISYEPRNEISTIAQLVFSERGLEVKSANGLETYLYQKNDQFTYAALGEASICLDSQFLQKLVAKITNPDILFTRSETDPRIIVIEAGTGTYNIPEKTDPNTGESINVETAINLDDVTPIILNDYVKFKNALNKCIPFTGESDGNATFNGIYCGRGSIIGSNGDTVCIMDNIPELASAEIYLTRDYAKKLFAINVDGKVDVAYKTTEGRIHPSVVKFHSINTEDKNEIIFMGSLQEDVYYNDFPIEGFLQFKQLTFGQTMKVGRSVFKEAVDRTTLFFQMNDNNELNLTITPGTMNIKSLSGGSDENVRVEGCVQALPTIRMNATQINLMLDNISTSEVVIKADGSNPGLMSVDDKDSLIILSEANSVQ